MFHPIRHFITITKHRNEVIRLCIKAGIGLQGLFHDLSKYSPTEFIPGAKYYTGKESPNNGERRDTGYSLAWMHHKGRNKHHFEFWYDYDMKTRKSCRWTCRTATSRRCSATAWQPPRRITEKVTRKRHRSCI